MTTTNCIHNKFEIKRYEIKLHAISSFRLTCQVFNYKLRNQNEISQLSNKSLEYLICNG